jgi:hypothetical protein
MQSGEKPENIHKKIIELKKQEIILSLVRELQQYMLSINSGTTDCSMLNSDQLENLALMI